MNGILKYLRWHGAEGENLDVWSIHHHGKLVVPAASGGKDSLAREVYRRNGVGAGDTPFFDSFHHPYAQTALSQVVDCPHEFWHRVVEIENDLRSHQLGYQRTHDQNIRHVMDVH